MRKSYLFVPLPQNNKYMYTKYSFLRNKIIIILLMTLFYAIPAWGDNVTKDGIVYRLLEDNKAAVTYDVSYLSKTSITIPPTITCETVDYTVVSIDAETFKNCLTLETITLPEHLGSVGENAFTGSGIKHITYNCATIGQRWFDRIKSQILTVNLGATVQTIGDAAFSGFENVESINIPGSVTTIANLAFEGWKKLESINIPSSVNSISSTSFLGCTNLTAITVTGGGTYHSVNNAIIDGDNKLILGCKGTTTIPASVTAIGNDAFRGVGITSITIPSDVTSIGERAFNNTGITTITIPKAVISIGAGAFNSCKKLIQITVEGDNATYDSRESCNAIIETATNKLLFGCGGTTIPSSVSVIAQNAFFGVSKEDFTITIPEGMTEIGKGAFNGCTGLTSVTYPSDFTTIGEEAFKGCNGLRTFTIPTSVTTINQHAFQECNGLESVTIPANVISLGDEVWYNCANIKIVKIEGGNKVDSELYLPTRTFKNCNKIEEIYFPNKAFYIKKEAFIGCKNIKKVYCQHSTSPYYPITESETIFDNELNLGNVTLYAFDNPSTHGEPWISFKTPFIHFDWFDKKIGTAGDEIYYNIINTGSEVYAIVASDQPNDIHPDKIATLYNRVNITIPSTIVVDGLSSPIPVENIERDAFKGKTEITTISFGNNIKSIDVSAFEGCTGIETVALGNTSLKEIASYAFKGCSALATVTLPNSTTKIGDEAFYNCVALADINIPTALTTLGKGAFYKCLLITSATLPAGITIINDDTFRDCGLLATVIFNGNVTKIGKNAFYNCLKLNSITLPNSLQSIGNEAFRSCTLLTSLTIPTNVNSIGEGAFRSCTGLTNIKFPNGLSTIESYSFNSCSNITSLALPAQLKTIKDHAFSDCTNLASVSFQDQVETIEEFAFESCTSIANIYSSRVTPPSVTNNSFASIYSTAKLYIPDGSQGAYSEDPVWVQFTHTSTIPLCNLKYVVDGEYPTEVNGDTWQQVLAGTPITPKAEPTNGSHEFSGWIGLPEIMPATDVTVTGNFKYTITYTITDELEEEYRYLTGDNNPKVVEEEHFCGDAIVTPTSGHNGYIINWANTPPTTMPKGNQSINGTIARQSFTLTYKIWNQNNSEFTTVPGIYKLYKESIDPNSNIPAPIPEDYVFEWDNYVQKMPAEDYEIEGHYIPQPVRGDIIYRLNDGSARIVGFANANTTSLVIPQTIDFNGSHNVTSIEHHAFNGYIKLESITFTSPSNLTSIGLQAFRDCKALEKIEIPESVSDIEKEAFMNCTALQSVSIEKGASPSLTLLKAKTFSGCTDLENITFPNRNGFQFEEFAFEGCNNIKKVYCLNNDYPGKKVLTDEELTAIGKDSHDTNPFNINLLDKPTLYSNTLPSTEPWKSFNYINSSNVNKAVETPTGNTLYYNIVGSGAGAYAIVTSDQSDDLTDKDENLYNRANIIIPDEITIGLTTYPVKSIERKAFYGKDDITSVTFGANIESIEESAFEGCTGITALALGSTKLSIIGPEAFKGCSELTNVTLPTTSTPKLQIGDEAFMGCAKLETINIPAQIDLIGESAFEGCQLLSSSINTTVSNDIGSKAFKGCSKLEAVTISGDITTIGSNAFYGCIKLSSITLPNSITKIESSAFYDCKALKYITLPSDLTTIGNAAFQNCTGLTSIILPPNLSSIGEQAFRGYVLKDIYCHRVNAPIANNNSFSDDLYTNGTVTLYLMNNAIGYDTASPWSLFVNKGEIMQYSLTYLLDGEAYPGKPQQMIYGGTPITKEPDPTIPAGRAFSGWEDEPEAVMPPHDVVVRGSFDYSLVYKFNDVTQVDTRVFCGKSITALKPSIPAVTGYSVKWSEDLDIMPARDVTITGNYVINKYKLTYVIDGDVYSQENKDYNDVITLPNMPQYEDHFFTWGNYPSRMPDNDLTIYGNYTAQKTINGVTIRVNKSSGTAEVFPNTDNINVTAVSIPETVTIKDLDGNYVSFPITSISKDAFSGYRKLTSISIPKTVNHIGVQAFRDCQLLRELILPNSIETIDKDAFLYCYGLKEIVCSAASMPNTHAEAFRNTNVTTKTTLYVPQNLLGNYKATTPWSSFYKIESISSFNPSDPSNPNNPVNPSNPSDPSNPNNPVNPSNPSDPSNPNNPVNPSNPSDTTNPSDPNNPTGINGIIIDGVEAEAFYTLEGRKINRPQHGINLVRLKDGRIVKHYFK